jgi:hypothetical protein
VTERMGRSWEIGLAVPFLASLLGIPVAVGIAIFKYRLYDIDVVIYRTLVYGSLTGVLALVYFGGVALLQGGLPRYDRSRVYARYRRLHPHHRSVIQSPKTWHPGLHRQALLPQEYDARKTLEAFSAKLRDETDLDALSDDLVGVVRETMQSTHVGLWLCPDREAKGGRGEQP